MKEALYKCIKRIFDLMSAALAIIVLSPLWLVVAIGIKLSSKGPVFYRADRIGRGNVKFTLLKFRSMHQYHPEVTGQGEQREIGYIANEQRIFPFGAFLRKSKIDELPQLLNILIGQMSVVGPRPITEAGVKKHYIGRYDEVLTVRPGLACLDSLYDYVHGELVVKDNEEFDKIVAPMRDYLASMYVKNQSIRLDVYCILMTIHLIFQVIVLRKKDFPLTKYERLAESAISEKKKVRTPEARRNDYYGK